MSTEETARANLAFIVATLAEVLADQPDKRALTRFHVAESTECARAIAAYIDQQHAGGREPSPERTS